MKYWHDTVKTILTFINQYQTRGMLKSRFNLSGVGAREETLEKEANVSEQSSVIPPTPPREDKPPERRLHSSEISVRLSMLGKTAEGDGYTYLKVQCTGMKLTNISALRAFQHLQFVDVSDNYLDIDSLQAVAELPFLVLIHADKNLLTSAAINKMKYMQVMIMNNNYITSVRDVYQPELSTLEVGHNKIEKIEFDKKMPTIKVLDFRYNLIKDVSNLDFPNLDSLYLAGNNIKSLEGTEKLVNLRILHVRNNPIRLLNGFDSDMKKLQYINLRNCKIASRKQVKKLKVLEALDTLILKGCPCMGGSGEEDAEVGDDDDTAVRVEILATLPKLKRINKTVVAPEERSEAKELIKQWIEEGEPDGDDDEEIEAEQGEQSDVV